MRVVEEGITDLEGYASVPISFQITSKIRLEELVLSKGRELVEVETGPRWKDYDAAPSERPTALPDHFDTRNWGVLIAYEEDVRLGGVIVARDSPGFDMLRGRCDLAVVADIRVQPEARGKGVGKTLFLAACDWARDHGCVELIVETQDTNVAACRFYSALGCTLDSVEHNAYGPDNDEVKLIWWTSL